MKELKKENLKIKICATNKEMGELAAKEAAEYINDLLSKQSEINIIFAAAPSQDTFLEALQTYSIDWTKINAYHMDEYIGLSSDAPQGFGNFLNGRIFSKLPFKSINFLSKAGNTPEEICTNYSELLKNNPPDIVMMGIGENAHIAFNDPEFAFFNDPQKVKIVKLDQKCRNQQLNDGCFAKIDDVPTHAVTLTIPTLTSAKRLFCMVPRATKAEAVKNVYFGEITEAVPATIMRRHLNATMYCDLDSAEFIKNEIV